MSITIVPIPAFNDNYIWLLINQQEKKAVCIDPGQASPLLEYLETHSLKLEGILVTHYHFDHTGGVTELVNFFPNLTVWGPGDSRIPFELTTVTGNTCIYLPFVEGPFSVISTPGHTKPHVCYYHNPLKILFCGDTLFSAGCGRLFEGSAKEMLESLSKLKELPKETKIYPAHEYTTQNLKFARTIEPQNYSIKEELNNLKSKSCTLPTTLQKELKINPFLRTNLYLEALPTILRDLGPLQNEAIIFQAIRTLKDNF